jgi:hypothetical protein
VQGYSSSRAIQLVQESYTCARVMQGYRDTGVHQRYRCHTGLHALHCYIKVQECYRGTRAVQEFRIGTGLLGSRSCIGVQVCRSNTRVQGYSSSTGIQCIQLK